MTTRRASDLAVPAPPLDVERPLPRVLPFPFIVGPHIVFEIMLRERERVTEKAAARHERRMRRGRPRA